MNEGRVRVDERDDQHRALGPEPTHAAGDALKRSDDDTNFAAAVPALPLKEPVVALLRLRSVPNVLPRMLGDDEGGHGRTIHTVE